MRSLRKNPPQWLAANECMTSNTPTVTRAMPNRIALATVTATMSPSTNRPAGIGERQAQWWPIGSCRSPTQRCQSKHTPWDLLLTAPSNRSLIQDDPHEHPKKHRIGLRLRPEPFLQAYNSVRSRHDPDTGFVACVSSADHQIAGKVLNSAKRGYGGIMEEASRRWVGKCMSRKSATPLNIYSDPPTLEAKPSRSAASILVVSYGLPNRLLEFVVLAAERALHRQAPSTGRDNCFEQDQRAVLPRERCTQRPPAVGNELSIVTACRLRRSGSHQQLRNQKSRTTGTGDGLSEF